MSIWENKTPELIKIYRIGESGPVKSGIVFCVKDGLAKLRKAEVECEDEWTYENILEIYGTPILQYESGSSSTSPVRLAAGYGIEKADCDELKAVDAAINSEYIDIDHSFEAVKPLLGLLEDGIYLLADAEITPTDGEGHFFWDIDPKFHYYDATISDYYLGCIDECDIYWCEVLDPIFLYPSQSADLFNRERAEYYAELFISSEEPPRAIAYNFRAGMNVLLDGHHKAAAAAMLGQKLKCLLIMPSHRTYGKAKGESFYRIDFTDDIYINIDKDDSEIDRMISDLKDKEDNAAKKPCFADILFRKRKWEDTFTDNSKKYPDAETNALEKYFGIPERYDEMINYLAENVIEKKSVRELINGNVFELRINDADGMVLVLRLLLEKAAFENDMRLKYTAMSAYSLDECYSLSADALRYLIQFRNDTEVEELFIRIISDESKYDRFGHIAAAYWEDES